MKVYLVKDASLTGEIAEAEAHRLTGHPDCVQVNGKEPGRRVFGKGEWHETYEGALEIVARNIARIEKQLDWEEAAIGQKRGRIDRARARLGLPCPSYPATAATIAS